LNWQKRYKTNCNDFTGIDETKRQEFVWGKMKCQINQRLFFLCSENIEQIFCSNYNAFYTNTKGVFLNYTVFFILTKVFAQIAMHFTQTPKVFF
jgi:hypothetical protein